jgi:hypothetical protein
MPKGIDLGNLVRAVQSADLIVKPRYERWLRQNPETFPLDPEIADIMWQLMTTPPRDRSRSFSCSAAGQCQRKQVFDFLGITAGKDTIIEPNLARIFANGTWSHMRTQATLLRAGILDSIEVTLRSPRLLQRGSVDGVGHVWEQHAKTHWRGRKYMLEFKTANSYAFRNSVNEGPSKYEQQTARYAFLGGFDLVVILMENKDNQELHEWVLEPTDELLDAQAKEVATLKRSVEREQLPKMLPECAMRKGPLYRRECPYGAETGACVRAGAWPTLRKESAGVVVV